MLGFLPRCCPLVVGMSMSSRSEAHWRPDRRTTALSFHEPDDKWTTLARCTQPARPIAPIIACLPQQRGFVAAGSKMACSSPYHSRSCTRSSKGKGTRRGVPAFQLCAFDAGLRRHEQGTDTAVSVMVKVVPPQPRRTADICTGCMVKLGAAGTKYWSLADRMCRLCKE